MNKKKAINQKKQIIPYNYKILLIPIKKKMQIQNQFKIIS